MDETIELLLKRMDDHPEEFCQHWRGENVPYPKTPDGRNASRWHMLTSDIERRVEWMHCRDSEREYDVSGCPLPFLTDEEVARLYNKLVAIKGRHFEEYVMRTLLGAEEQPEEWTVPINSMGSPSPTIIWVDEASKVTTVPKGTF